MNRAGLPASAIVKLLQHYAEHLGYTPSAALCTKVMKHCLNQGDFAALDQAWMYTMLHRKRPSVYHTLIMLLGWEAQKRDKDIVQLASMYEKLYGVKLPEAADAVVTAAKQRTTAGGGKIQTTQHHAASDEHGSLLISGCTRINNLM